MRTTRSIGDKFISKVRTLEYTRKRIDELARNNSITSRDADQVYEGLFLSVHIAFESFLEQLFTVLIVSTSNYRTSQTDINARIGVNSYKIAKELIYRGYDYVEWMPYSKTQKLASLYLTGGRPFSNINDSEKGYLKKCSLIRNVIAHKSAFSIAQFKEKVIGNAVIPNEERQVARYLRGIYRISPVQSRYELYVSILISISRKLSE